MKKEAEDEALERVWQACDDLVRLSRSQMKAFADGDPEALDSLLQERDRLISSLDAETGFLKSVAAGDGGNAGAAVGLRVLARERLKDLLLTDEESRKALQARLEETKAQLAALSRGRQAMYRYAHIHHRAEAVYVDKLQ